MSRRRSLLGRARPLEGQPGFALGQERPHFPQDDRRVCTSLPEGVDAPQPLEYASRLVHADNVRFESRRDCHPLRRIGIVLVTFLRPLASPAAIVETDGRRSVR